MRIRSRKPDGRLLRRVSLAFLGSYLAVTPSLLLLGWGTGILSTAPVLEMIYGPAITVSCAFLLFLAGACLHLERHDW